MGKTIEKIGITFSKIDKAISPIFLYYSAILGFIMGWISLAVILLSSGIGLNDGFVLLLRIFYFMLAFVFSLKPTIFLVKLIRKALD